MLSHSPKKTSLYGKQNNEFYMASQNTGILHRALCSSQPRCFPTINDNRFTTSAPLVVLGLPRIMNTYVPVRTDFDAARSTLNLGPHQTYFRLSADNRTAVPTYLLIQQFTRLQQIVVRNCFSSKKIHQHQRVQKNKFY